MRLFIFSSAAALILFSFAANAAEPSDLPMSTRSSATTIDFTAPILDFDGKPARDCFIPPYGSIGRDLSVADCDKAGDKVLVTLGKVSAAALIAYTDNNAVGPLLRGNLALKVYSNKAAVLTIDELADIKLALQAKSFGYSALITARAVAILDPNDKGQ